MKLQNGKETMDLVVNGSWRVFILYHMQKSIPGRLQTNMKGKAIKLLENNIKKYICNLGLKKDSSIKL